MSTYTTNNTSGFYVQSATAPGGTTTMSNAEAIALLNGTVVNSSITDFSSEVAGFPSTGEYFAVRYTGYVNADEAGTWTFNLNADDGLVFRVNGEEYYDRLPGAGTGVAVNGQGILIPLPPG
jgi:hypothetical protein